MNIVQEVQPETGEGSQGSSDDRYSSGTGVRKKETRHEENGNSGTDINHNRRRINEYHSNYQEALRSLLWEPYECREEHTNYYSGLGNRVPVMKRAMSPTDSSLSSTSSNSSLDELLTVEMVRNEGERSDYKYISERVRVQNTSALDTSSERKNFEIDKRTSWPVLGKEKNKCNIVNKGMVSDLYNKDGGYSLLKQPVGSLVVDDVEKYASVQCEFGSDVNNVGDRSSIVDDLNMLVQVAGTLEPRDTTEDTRLVSPDSSLDVDRNVTSANNVSVVSCYRAVPVAVVSTVPTIQCLNTQQNVSNVNIIQTTTTGNVENVRRTSPNDVGLPKMIALPRHRIQVPNVKPRLQPRSVNVQRPKSQEVQQQARKQKERERPKSSVVTVNNVEQELTAPSTADVGTSSRVALGVHSRSVSNPVLGARSPPVGASRSTSQQNINSGVRLETHFNIVPTTVVKEVATTEEPPKPSPRTFTSTEAQTDDVPINIPVRSTANRDQRRRERRERRHQRRLLNQSLTGVWSTQDTTQAGGAPGAGLPDILNSHLPPPYTTMPGVLTPPTTQGMIPISLPPPLPMITTTTSIPHLIEPQSGSPTLQQTPSRFPFPFHGTSRRRSRRSPRGQTYTPEDESPKSCCGVVVNQTVSIRWFIVMIAFVGICCVIVGTVLGAMKASGREHLTVSLLMIGVGIVLVTVSGVAWRLTSHDAPSCRLMLGLGGGDDSSTEPNRRFVPRMPPSYGRPHHPYAAMMYPEFQYRPPPPSYQASMQEYRLRLLLLERPNSGANIGQQTAMSPPPIYRSQVGGTLGLRPVAMCRSQPQSEYSHPPSYRSRTSSSRPTLDPTGAFSSVNHSRDASLISHVSDPNGNVTQAVVNVISVVGDGVDIHQDETDLPLDAIKIGVEQDDVPIPPIRMLLNKGGGKKSSPQSSDDNINLVTIVTVSDVNCNSSRDHIDTEVLAHL